MIALLAILVPLCYVGFYALAGVMEAARFRQVSNALSLILPLGVFATHFSLGLKVFLALVMGISLFLGAAWAAHIRRKQGY
ncbi:hypothetical protein ACMA5I_03855 [Paracoccaceae bacterium GXU_MW_L88]